MGIQERRTTLITGGASGIGALLFTKLAAEDLNNTVVIGDISDGSELVRKTKEKTGNQNLLYLPLDVTDFSSQQRFFREAAKFGHGVIHSVVVNAGVATTRDSQQFLEPPDYTSGSLDHKPPRSKTIDVNLTGALLSIHIAISYLTSPAFSSTKPPPDRSITAIGSIAGLYGLPAVPLYAVAKHALTGFVRSVRFHDRPWRINLICPYFVATPILGVGGNVLMSGTALATIEDVAAITARTVTDPSLDGRVYIVTPPATVGEARALGIRVKPDRHRGGTVVGGHDVDSDDKLSSIEEDKDKTIAVWECFDPDDVLLEDFAQRMIRLIRLRQFLIKRKSRIRLAATVLSIAGAVGLLLKARTGRRAIS